MAWLRETLTAATPTVDDERSVVQPLKKLDDLAREIRAMNNALVQQEAQLHEVERNIQGITERLRTLQAQMVERVKELGIRAEVV